MTNPEVGPRCGACRLGLVTHVPEDPQCIDYLPACSSTYTLGEVKIGCTKHLKSNPFRGDGFMHCGLLGTLEFYWSSREEDKVEY